MKKYLLYIIGYVILSVIYEYITIVTDVYNLPLPHNLFGYIIAYSFLFVPIVLGYLLFKKYIKKENQIFMKEWTLQEFAKEYGPKMQVGEFTTLLGNTYRKCIFSRPDKLQTFVKFHPSLGELSASEISQRKDELKVGITVAKMFYLYKDNVSIWEDVNL